MRFHNALLVLPSFLRLTLSAPTSTSISYVSTETVMLTSTTFVASSELDKRSSTSVSRSASRETSSSHRTRQRNTHSSSSRSSISPSIRFVRAATSDVRSSSAPPLSTPPHPSPFFVSLSIRPTSTSISTSISTSTSTSTPMPTPTPTSMSTSTSTSTSTSSSTPVLTPTPTSTSTSRSTSTSTSLSTASLSLPIVPPPLSQKATSSSSTSSRPSSSSTTTTTTTTTTSLLPSTPSPKSSYLSQVARTLTTLQTFYDWPTGLYYKRGWWMSANALTVLADATILLRDNNIDDNIDTTTHTNINPPPKHADADKQNRKHHHRSLSRRATDNLVDQATAVLNNTYVQSQKTVNSGFTNFLNDFYDDEGWWALFWIRAWDLTHDIRYLSLAETIFLDMTTAWGAPCGGVWWNKQHWHQVSIATELLMSVAASLSNRVEGADKKKGYYDWSVKVWTWFQGKSQLIGARGTIIDGLDMLTCQPTGAVWTYNQGVVLGALVEMHLFDAGADTTTSSQTNDTAPGNGTVTTSYLQDATFIAAGAINRLTGTNGILKELCEPTCGATGAQFKGIFMRNLQQLYNVRPRDDLKDFIVRNANSLWESGRGEESEGGVLGLVWSGPYRNSTANWSSHSSGMEAIVAAAAVVG